MKNYQNQIRYVYNDLHDTNATDRPICVYRQRKLDYRYTVYAKCLNQQGYGYLINRLAPRAALFPSPLSA